MRKEIKAFKITDPRVRQEFSFRDFSVCPLCHHAIQPVPVEAMYYWDPDEAFGGNGCNALYISFLCTNCKHIILRRTGLTKNSYGALIENSSPTFYPYASAKTSFSDGISALSSSFVTVYNQAEEAEASGLDEICGIGYRKAIEFLIKDYCISKDTEHREDIMNEFLGKTVDRIADTRIQTLAKGSVWLGNDQTHYIKKHEDRDIEDMKRFINAMVHFIDAEISFQEALGFVLAPSKT